MIFGFFFLAKIAIELHSINSMAGRFASVSVRDGYRIRASQ